MVNFTFRDSAQNIVEDFGEVTLYIDRVGITDVDFILMVTECKCSLSWSCYHFCCIS